MFSTKMGQPRLAAISSSSINHRPNVSLTEKNSVFQLTIPPTQGSNCFSLIASSSACVLSSTIFCIQASAWLTAKSFIHFSINSNPQKFFFFRDCNTQPNLGPPLFALLYNLWCCESLTLHSCIFQQTLILSKSRNERFSQLSVVLLAKLFLISASSSLFPIWRNSYLFIGYFLMNYHELKEPLSNSHIPFVS